MKANGKVTKFSFDVSCGVPQGSHIGPVLFIIFTADLVESISPLDVQLLKYADDTKLYAYVDNDMQRRKLQTGIDTMVQWSRDNGLDLSHNKTKWITYGTRRKTYKSYYYVETNRLERETSVRDLGIYFDCKLSFKHHHQYVLDRCRKAYGAAYRFTLHFGNRTMLLYIFNIYIRPILEYASIIWTGNSVTADTKLEETLRKTTRFVLATAYRPHLPGYITYEQRLKVLHQMALRTRRIIASVVIVERIRLGKLSVTFGWQIMECFVENPAQHRIRLRYKINRSQFIIDSPMYNAMMETNSLRYQFEHEDSLNTIKRKLTNYFLEEN